MSSGNLRRHRIGANFEFPPRSNASIAERWALPPNLRERSRATFASKSPDDQLIAPARARNIGLRRSRATSSAISRESNPACGTPQKFVAAKRNKIDARPQAIPHQRFSEFRTAPDPPGSRFRDPHAKESLASLS